MTEREWDQERIKQLEEMLHDIEPKEVTMTDDLTARVDALERQVQGHIHNRVHGYTILPPSPAPAGDDAAKDHYIEACQRVIGEYDNFVTHLLSAYDDLRPMPKHMKEAWDQWRAEYQTYRKACHAYIALGKADPPGGRRVVVTWPMVDAAWQSWSTDQDADGQAAMQRAIGAALAAHDAPRMVPVGDDMDDKPEVL